jgi:hypothetical protein
MESENIPLFPHTHNVPSSVITKVSSHAPPTKIIGRAEGKETFEGLLMILVEIPNPSWPYSLFPKV